MTAPDLKERLRDGLDGVTPGPWDVMTCNTVRAIDGDVAIPIFDARTPWNKHRRTSTALKQEWHNARHVANCDPDNIRVLLAELESLEARIARLSDCLERAAVAAYSKPHYLGPDGMTPGADGLLPPGSPYDRGRYDARKAVEALATSALATDGGGR